jgi:hypothetical protein
LGASGLLLNYVQMVALADTSSFRSVESGRTQVVLAQCFCFVPTADIRAGEVPHNQVVGGVAAKVAVDGLRAYLRGSVKLADHGLDTRFVEEQLEEC